MTNTNNNANVKNDISTKIGNGVAKATDVTIEVTRPVFGWLKAKLDQGVKAYQERQERIQAEKDAELKERIENAMDGMELGLSPAKLEEVKAAAVKAARDDIARELREKNVKVVPIVPLKKKG